MDHLNNSERGLVLQALRCAKERLLQDLKDSEGNESEPAARAFVKACDVYNQYESEFVSRLTNRESLTVEVETDNDGFLIVPLTPKDIVGSVSTSVFPIKELGLYDILFEEAGVQYARKVWVVPTL